MCVFLYSIDCYWNNKFSCVSTILLFLVVFHLSFQECLRTVLDTSLVNSLYWQQFFYVQFNPPPRLYIKIWNNLIHRFLDFMCKCILTYIYNLSYVTRSIVCNALASTLWINDIIFTMVLNFLRFKFSNQSRKKKGQQVCWQFGKSQAQWLIHQIRVSERYCGNFVLISFLGSLIKALCWKHCKYDELVWFFCVHGEWTGARNKEIVQEPLCDSCSLFVKRYDSFPVNT